MITAVVVVVLASLAFAAIAPVAGPRLPPAVATRTLVGGSLAIAGSTLFVAGVVAFTWVGQLPQIGGLGAWSSAALHRDDPIPDHDRRGRRRTVADEAAADAVRGRHLAARTLARTALLIHRGPPAGPTASLGVLHGDVPHRVRAALLNPPVPHRRSTAAALLALALACALAAGAVEQFGERLSNTPAPGTTLPRTSMLAADPRLIKVGNAYHIVDAGQAMWCPHRASA